MTVNNDQHSTAYFSFLFKFSHEKVLKKSHRFKLIFAQELENCFARARKSKQTQLRRGPMKKDAKKSRSSLDKINTESIVLDKKEF